MTDLQYPSAAGAFERFRSGPLARRAARRRDGYVGHGFVCGEQLDLYFGGLLTPVFNVMSRCPLLSVPSSFADDRVPTGVQIATRTYADETVFRLGAAVERERPWEERRPDIVAAAGA